MITPIKHNTNSTPGTPPAVIGDLPSVEDTPATKSQPPFPDLQKFCVITPLYDKFSLLLSESNIADIIAFNIPAMVHYLMCAQGIFDFHCVGCKQDSTFTTRDRSQRYDGHIPSSVLFTREFTCARNEQHKAYFHFRIHDNKIEKIGQSPSLADLANADIKKYKNLLTEDQFRELSKAVGLAAHGVGIGSFVYLRRIFEGLIEEAAILTATEKSWNQEAFGRAKMDEKIKMVGHHLPEFLVRQRKIYGILSKGIHNLSEEECLKAFPILKGSIEMILDLKQADKLREEKQKEITEKLGEIHSAMKSED